MTYQEEERSKLRRQSTKQAIALAMEGNWKEAVAINQGILEVFPNDVEALNRLGRAYMELGNYHEAETAYRRTTDIDPYNAIAAKNLQRLSLLKESAVATEADADRLEPEFFIEEVGKSGVVQLVNLASPDVVARMVAGDRVRLRIEEIELVVENSRGEYLGQVELRHGQRLARLMRGGNRYSAAVVSLAEGAVRVIIRELYRDPSQAGKPSFPSTGMTGGRPDYTDRVLRRELELGSASVDAGYTVVGGDDTEILAEEPPEDDFEISDEE